MTAPSAVRVFPWAQQLQLSFHERRTLHETLKSRPILQSEVTHPNKWQHNGIAIRDKRSTRCAVVATDAARA